ncbi:hypothetical protein [Acuticoccus sp. MNP-M23]|uniref:DUF6979 family protein n=1 Tax=Acuticoccus sp. MNP-M23 TaxID=3072793 RepID=UPI0035C20490
MGKYGIVAVNAARLLAGEGSSSPRSAWEQAAKAVFPNSPSSQCKGCPRNAFLALCEMGLLARVVTGSYTRSEKNKSYVCRALMALRLDHTLATDKQALWKRAVLGEPKKHNSQMDVLLALWRNRLIE